MMLMPIQSPLVELVGLRGQIFFVPFLLVGAMLDGGEMRKIAMGFAILSLIELAFALAEIEFGLTRFYPMNSFNSVLGISARTIPPTYAQLYSGEWTHAA
jgi:hypothetical protein